jgi:hypothetical protein
VCSSDLGDFGCYYFKRLAEKRTPPPITLMLK